MTKIKQIIMILALLLMGYLILNLPASVILIQPNHDYRYPFLSVNLTTLIMVLIAVGMSIWFDRSRPDEILLRGAPSIRPVTNNKQTNNKTITTRKEDPIEEMNKLFEISLMAMTTFTVFNQPWNGKRNNP